MRIMKCNSIAHAHELSMKHLLRQGRTRVTEDNEISVETPPMTFVLNNPLNEPRIHELSLYRQGFCDAYADQIINGKPEGDSDFDYTYHDRLFKYPYAQRVVDRYRSYTINQIDHIIEYLKDEPMTRRAIGITWKPEVDTGANAKNPPCLQLVHAWINPDDKLDLSVVFRSNDMLGAVAENMYGLIALHKYIADNVGVDIGTYMHSSTIPHFYLVKNFSEVKKWITYFRMVPSHDIRVAAEGLEWDLEIQESYR